MAVIFVVANKPCDVVFAVAGEGGAAVNECYISNFVLFKLQIIINFNIMKLKKLIKLIEDNGWCFVRQKGSYKVYKHKTKEGIVVVPDHGQNKDIQLGTENSILKQAGLK